MNRRRFLSSLAGGLASLAGCSRSDSPARVEPQPPESNLVLAHGTLVDGTGADPIRDSVLVISQGAIESAGSAIGTSVPPDAQVVDVSGCTVLPGFINAHVHSSYDEATLRAWARGGVTTIRDLGADPARPLFALRDELGRNPQSARLVAAGPLVTVPNGYPIVPWSSRSALPVLSPQDAREKVGQLLDDGAEIVKIAVESGASFSLTIPVLSRDEIAAIVAVAHERGTRTTAHVLTSDDLARALNGGVDELAHMVCDQPSDALMERAVAMGVLWVPTLELWRCVGGGPRQRAISNLRRFVQAGGSVALGTDYAGYTCSFDLGLPLREIESLLSADMTPMQIVVAATRQGARACNREHNLGTLQPGKIADVLVVAGDPLHNIQALEDVVLVLRAGVAIEGSLVRVRGGG